LQLSVKTENYWTYIIKKRTWLIECIFNKEQNLKENCKTTQSSSPATSAFFLLVIPPTLAGV